MILGIPHEKDVALVMQAARNGLDELKERKPAPQWNWWNSGTLINRSEISSWERVSSRLQQDYDSLNQKIQEASEESTKYFEEAGNLFANIELARRVYSDSRRRRT